uniref:DUF4794 domain-containing protein n=1 Tax=Anopheles maculatus TaxID=74869 RepID=A0A182T5L1_9DIPT
MSFVQILIALVSVLTLASAQQQLIDPYFNEGLVQYNDWQPIPGPNVAHPYVGPQFLPAQQYPLLQQVPAVPFPQVPVPFPAQLPLQPYLQPGQYPYQLQLPVPPQQQQQLLPGFQALPPFNMAQLPPQVQVVRHGLPHSDAAAVSYSSLNYNNNTPQPATLQTPPVAGVSTAPASGVNSAAAVPVAPNAKIAVVKDIATFGTEYGTGADKSPVARYEAINAGSVHVAPLPGHTVDQKLIAPGTTEQKL